MLPRALVHLEDFKGLRGVHERGDVADRANVHLRTRQEGHGAVQIDGEAALDLVEDEALDALAGVELRFKLDPAFLAACLLAAQHGFAKRVFDALDIDFDFVADLEIGFLALRAEFLQRHAALDLEADIDDRHVFLDGGDDALYDGAFGGVAFGEGFCEKAREIIARRIEF